MYNFGGPLGVHREASQSCMMTSLFFDELTGRQLPSWYQTPTTPAESCSLHYIELFIGFVLDCAFLFG